MSFADCRAAARAVRMAQHGREALAVVRPPSVLGIVHARAPLSIILMVAVAEGRFVRAAPDSFALLERPIFAAKPAMVRRGLGFRLLRFIDRRWDAILFTAPPAAMLTTASVLGLLAGWRDQAPPTAVAWLAACVVLYVAVFMTGQVVSQAAWMRKAMGRKVARPDEIAAQSYPGWNWSLTLCHHTGKGDGGNLLRLAYDRMADLVKAQVERWAEANGAEPERLRVREVLVCLTGGVTTDTMRRIVADVLVQPFGEGTKVALRLPLDPVRDYREPVKANGGFFLVWLGGIAVLVAVLATMVASWESQACADCGGRPTTFLAALQWLAWRLVWQDAPGIAPGTFQSLTIGWLLSLVGLMSLPVAWVSAKLTIDANKRVHANFRELNRSLDHTRILLLTTTPVERDAALVAFRSVTNRDPERSFPGDVVIYELGSAGRTLLGLAQCARPGAGAPGGAQATATAVIDRWKPHLVIMLGICYGLREDWTPPQELGDVIVASTIYDLDRRIRHDDRTELFGDRVSTATALVSGLQAASTDWPVAKVWCGLLLSSQTLVDSKAYRDEVKKRHSRALGGEMEAHGLYAAAADAGVPWIVAKAISDWGVDRDLYYEPELAAANAAAFVAHAITIGAFDQVPHHRAGR